MAPGTDGAFEYHFDPQPRLTPRQREDGSMDYHSVLADRSVAEGARLVSRRAPVPGTAGRDVLGRPIDAPPGKDVELPSLSGLNTAVRVGALVATAAGRPIVGKSGRVEVLPVFEVAGDLGYSVGNIDFAGDVVIHGDVKPDFTIAATGSVVVHGLVEGASISAKRDLSVAGAAGEHGCHFEVGGNLVAQYLHGSSAKVGGEVTVAREIVNCTLTADRVDTGNRGRIVGGSVTAKREIDTGSLGANQGTLTEVFVTTREHATVRARIAAHPGVAVHVGRARRAVEDELPAVSFWDAGGTLVTLRATAESADGDPASGGATAAPPAVERRGSAPGDGTQGRGRAARDEAGEPPALSPLRSFVVRIRTTPLLHPAAAGTVVVALLGAFFGPRVSTPPPGPPGAPGGRPVGPPSERPPRAPRPARRPCCRAPSAARARRARARSTRRPVP
ncbi:MAG: DUF342 domain-containing protein [Chloroflexi bacterium]|nr:DUF342 domain-containing protein [Chloroflexota bacterium]